MRGPAVPVLLTTNNFAPFHAVWIGTCQGPVRAQATGDFPAHSRNLVVERLRRERPRQKLREIPLQNLDLGPAVVAMIDPFLPGGRRGDAMPVQRVPRDPIEVRQLPLVLPVVVQAVQGHRPVLARDEPALRRALRAPHRKMHVPIQVHGLSIVQGQPKLEHAALGFQEQVPFLLRLHVPRDLLFYGLRIVRVWVGSSDV